MEKKTTTRRSISEMMPKQLYPVDVSREVVIWMRRHTDKSGNVQAAWPPRRLLSWPGLGCRSAGRKSKRNKGETRDRTGHRRGTQHGRGERKRRMETPPRWTRRRLPVIGARESGLKPPKEGPHTAVSGRWKNTKRAEQWTQSRGLFSFFLQINFDD